jgi:hypothetical protein
VFQGAVWVVGWMTTNRQIAHAHTHTSTVECALQHHQLCINKRVQRSHAAITCMFTWC